MMTLIEIGYEAKRSTLFHINPGSACCQQAISLYMNTGRLNHVGLEKSGNTPVYAYRNDGGGSIYGNLACILWTYPGYFVWSLWSCDGSRHGKKDVSLNGARPEKYSTPSAQLLWQDHSDFSQKGVYVFGFSAHCNK